MYGPLILSVLTMNVDLFVQEVSQSAETGAIKREWAYNKTIPCRVDTIAERGASVEGNFKNVGELYKEELKLKIKTIDRLSKRYRLQNFVNRDGDPLYIEFDKIDAPSTIFEVISTGPIMDPLGRIAFFESTVRRMGVQDNG